MVEDLFDKVRYDKNFAREKKIPVVHVGVRFRPG